MIINSTVVGIRLGRISDSLARSIKEDIRSEIVAVKEAADKERESQAMCLTRRLNDDKRHHLLQLVNLLTEYNKIAQSNLGTGRVASHPTHHPKPQLWASDSSRTFAQLCRKLPIGYNGRPTFTPKNTPFHGPIPKPNYLPYHWTYPTYHPKPYSYLISCFATILWTDRHTDTDQRMVGENVCCSMTIGRFLSIESAAA